MAGPILLLYVAFAVLKPKIQSSANGGMEALEIAVENAQLFGMSLRDLGALLPAGVQIVARRGHHRNEAALPDLVIAPKDVLLATASTKEELQQPSQLLGKTVQGRLVKDRADLDHLRVFASRSALVGKALGTLELPREKSALVVEILRGDAHMQPRPELLLEFGDRVGVLAHCADFAALRKYFGDSILFVDIVPAFFS